MPHRTHTWWPYGYPPTIEEPIHPYPHKGGHPYYDPHDHRRRYGRTPHAHPYPYPYYPFEFDLPVESDIVLCPLVAMPPPHAKSEIIYDVRTPVSSARRRHHHHDKLSASERNAPLLYPTSAHLFIISKQFPWGIELSRTNGVTCEDLLTGVHEALHKPITPPEWWIAPPDQRKKVVENFEKNCAADKTRDRNKGIFRVDWLCDKTFILGLEKDDEFIEERMDDKKAMKDTWVLALTQA